MPHSIIRVLFKSVDLSGKYESIEFKDFPDIKSIVEWLSEKKAHMMRPDIFDHDFIIEDIIDVSYVSDIEGLEVKPNQNIVENIITKREEEIQRDSKNAQKKRSKEEKKLLDQLIKKYYDYAKELIDGGKS
jgi:hypothetical protein